MTIRQSSGDSHLVRSIKLTTPHCLAPQHSGKHASDVRRYVHPTKEVLTATVGRPLWLRSRFAATSRAVRRDLRRPALAHRHLGADQVAIAARTARAWCWPTAIARCRSSSSRRCRSPTGARLTVACSCGPPMHTCLRRSSWAPPGASGYSHGRVHLGEADPGPAGRGSSRGGKAHARRAPSCACCSCAVGSTGARRACASWIVAPVREHSRKPDEAYGESSSWSAARISSCSRAGPVLAGTAGLELALCRNRPEG